MKFRMIGLGMIALCATTLSIAEETAPPDGKVKAEMPGSSQRGMSNISSNEMKKLDQNNDGAVSRDEAKADATWRKQFDDLDANDDDKVDAAELIGKSRSDAGERQGRSEGGKDSLPTPSY